MESEVRAYFLSDLHLGARYYDDPHAKEREVVAFLDTIKEDATHIFLLGDILDYWFEYRYAVPKGFTRFFGKLAELADRGIEITWFAGNHDIWLFGYFEQELGIRTFDGSMTVELAGKTFFLNHGDTVGYRPPKFRFIQSFFRNRICQKLFSGIHPRWTIPFALRWSQSSRKSGNLPPRFNPEETALTDFAREYRKKHPEIDYFIFGHLHLKARVEIAPGCEMILLGEWIHSDSYALFDGESLELRNFPH